MKPSRPPPTAQNKVADEPGRARPDDRDHSPHLRRQRRRAGHDGTRRDQDRPPRPQDREAARSSSTCSASRHAHDALSDSTGLCIIERAPWGVIGMVLPATHSVPTMAEQRDQHHRGRQCRRSSARTRPAQGRGDALRAFNRAIQRETGIDQHRHRMAEADASRAPKRSSTIPASLLSASPAARRREGGDADRQARHLRRPRQSAGLVDDTADLDRRARRSSRAQRTTTTCCASARRKSSSSLDRRRRSRQRCGSPARWSSTTQQSTR